MKELAEAQPFFMVDIDFFLIIMVINFDTQLDTQQRFGAIFNTHPTSGMNHKPQVCHQPIVLVF
jgi:hypothetical protein